MSKTRCRNAARRLACFLDTIGIHPALEQRTTRERYRFLLELYSALPRESQREARRRGRRIIRQIGLVHATLKSYPTNRPEIKLTPEEREKRMADLLGHSIGRCTSCSSWGQYKRVWPSTELALAFRPFAGDMSLHAYECPAVPGSYHLGHWRKQPAPALSGSDHVANVT